MTKIQSYTFLSIEWTRTADFKLIVAYFIRLSKTSLEVFGSSFDTKKESSSLIRDNSSGYC